MCCLFRGQEVGAIPYIKDERRRELDPHIEALADKKLDAGDLNYAVTRLGMIGIRQQGGLKYARLALLIGTLVCVIFELYRRVGSSYEDEAINRNGDVEEFKKE